LQLLIDILQGMGLAGAAGVRPFLPALVAGALATRDIGVDYEGTPFSFLEQPGWLLAVVVVLIAADAVLGYDRVDCHHRYADHCNRSQRRDRQYSVRGQARYAWQQLEVPGTAADLHQQDPGRP